MVAANFGGHHAGRPSGRTLVGGSNCRGEGEDVVSAAETRLTGAADVVVRKALRSAERRGVDFILF